MINQVVNRLKKNSAFKYIVAGGLAYIAELCCLYTLSRIIGIDAVLSVAISFWVGFGTSFYLQKVHAFSNRSRGKVVVKQLILYSLLVAINYLFTIWLVHTLDNLDIFISRTIALAITTVWNYFLYKYVLFK